MRSTRVVAVLAAAILAMVLGAAGSARAQLFAIGAVAPLNPEATCQLLGEFDEVQISTAPGASYAVPALGGAIISWSTSAAAGSGQMMGLRVFRPLGDGKYLLVGRTPMQPLVPSVLNTFATSIPVQAGDLIGLHNPSTIAVPDACLFATSDAADVFAYEVGERPLGGIFDPGAGGEIQKMLLNVSATILPPPVVTGLSVASGSVAGGAAVAIAGANFAEVKSVNFGSVPAGFTVGSESQIVVVAPGSAMVATVPVTVTTAAGTSSPVATFSYEGCTVPKLAGKKLAAAKKALKRSDCKLGAVAKKNGATAKTGRVTKQNPAPGKTRRPGTRVKVTLG